eukprot:5386113-Heterocapsa_arctica.AAC.1
MVNGLYRPCWGPGRRRHEDLKAVGLRRSRRQRSSRLSGASEHVNVVRRRAGGRNWSHLALLLRAHITQQLD